MASSSSAIGEKTASLGLDAIPEPVPSPNILSPTKSMFNYNWPRELRLTKVIGTTTSSACGFDFNASKSCFVTCAGSVVVWSDVDSNLNITQRFFRAHPSVPSQTDSIELGTPTKSERRRSRLSPVRALGFRQAAPPSSPATPGTPGTPGRNGARQGSRAASCVSLSQDGRILAVGEVCIHSAIRELAVLRLSGRV